MASKNTKKTTTTNGSYKRGQSQPQWTDLPNNLDLRSIPQSSKKQRNKDGLTDRGKPSFQNMHGSNSNRHFSTNHPSNKLSLAAWQSEQQLVADSEHEEVNHQNLFRQHRQNSHYQNTQQVSDGSRSLCESNASKQYKEDNTKKTPDTSIIVERLMHLRDCIKQVSSIMNNLEKTDEPVTRDQMKRLNNMLKQLQQEEQQHFDLLQQMLVTNEEASASSNSPDRAYVIPSNDIETNVKEQNGELEETIEHGQRLMRKMIESQEKMESLKKQQAELLSMQKQAEDKLAEAKSFHVTLMKKEAAVKNQIGRCNYPLDWKNKESDRLSNNIEERTNEDNEIQPMWQIRNSEENSMNDGNQAVNWSTDIPSSGLEVTFENLKQRLEHLKDLAYNKTSEEANEKISEMKDAKSELHRKKLENKLKEIQAKKKHMDKMLVELSALEQASVNVKNSQSNTTQFVTADSTIQEAQHLLDTIDAREKVKKLEEMKESLSQLRAMVNSIQPMNGDVSSINNEDHVETISNSSKSSSQVIKHRSDSKTHQNSQQISQVKKDNIRQDHSNKFPVRRHYEAEGRANEDGDTLTPVSSVQDGNSGIDEYWENDPQVQEKVRKLKEAKQKLQRLQSLMSAVQNSKDNGDSATMEYLQLISAISDEERQEVLENNSQLNSNDLNGFGDGEMIETQNQHKDMIRLEAVEEKMQQQQEELEKLMEERKKLLHMQTQLTKLQHQFPNSSSVSDERGSMQQKSSKKVCANSNSLSSRTLSPCRQIRSDNYILGRQNLSYEQPNTNMKSRSDSKKTVSKKDNINSMSANLSGRIKDGKDDVLNSDVNENNAMDTLLIQANELDNSLMLQEIKQNVLLEDILRQNHKHQEYSNNEDIRSQSGSSANSEFQEESNSILAPDTTAAATWGGSSTQNDFEDEPVESLEEQDGSETEAPCDGNLWQAQNKVHSIQQPYIREMMQTEQSTTVTRQNDNRISSQQNFKSEGINRWNVKKNFQDQQRNHINSTHNQDNVYGANRSNLEEPVSSQNLLLSDGTCNLAVWQQFTQHIHQQLEHMNTLCQSIFQDQQTLTSCLQSCSLSSPSLAIGRPSYPVFSDILHQHTHQFQQQQQLLLSLSQCYHMIYLQQLEIQYLHQCLQQSSSSEQTVPQASPNINQDRINEEFTFRPWLTTQSANANSSFPPVQASPVSTSCVHSNTANTLLPTSNSTPNRFNLSAPVSSNCNFARQTAVAATLNNQVPPRTRANNFWDNFRSCSRQNMLSTSKSNEIISANLSNPQIPDSTTTVCDHQVQMKNQSYSEKTANSDYFRAKTRHVSNAKMQENINKSKKPNSSKDRGLFSCFVNKASSTQQLTTKSKSLPEKSIRPKQSSAPRVSDNISISNVPIFADSNNSILSPFSNARPREAEVKSTGNTSTMQESVYAEVSKIISQADGQPEFLLDFLKKLKHLRLDSQQAFSGSQHTSINQEENQIKNKDRFIKTIKREQSDNFIDNSDNVSVPLAFSSQIPLKDVCEDPLSYSFSQPKEEAEVITSVAAATGAVRKRTYNKRAKLEHISLPQVNGIGRNSDHNENSNEKSEPLSSNQEDSENKAEQEVKDVVGMDLNSLMCQSNNRTAQIAEEDMIYECDPEGETEPYIEAETDDTKDLAEADQSPGQRTSVVDHVQHFRQIESPQLVSSLGNATNNFLVNSGLRNESLSSIPVAIDGLEDNSVDQQDIAAGGEQIQSCLDNDQTIDELPLDDIPTKLIPLSEGELSKQMTEEINAASLIQEMISEELSDVVKEQNHF